MMRKKIAEERSKRRSREKGKNCVSNVCPIYKGRRAGEEDERGRGAARETNRDKDQCGGATRDEDQTTATK